MAIYKDITILGIESSCDETSAAVIRNGELIAHVTATQKVHERYGGVVPELASRAHQQHIIPVTDAVLKDANLQPTDLDAIAFTRGPGLLGALLVGTSFAKSMALALGIPLIDVNHMQAHILAHFIRKPGEEKKIPEFPLLCLTVSGGHTQLVVVRSALEMEVIGETIDDAAGEAFDKTAKIMGLPYPGGPLIDKLAATGDPLRFRFSHPKIAGYDFSFSGLKTQVLYFLRDQEKMEPGFTEKNRHDICASVQHTIVEILLDKLRRAARALGITRVALAGGVSANSGLRKKLLETGAHEGWEVFIPPFEYCTDNAAMIAMTGHFKYHAGLFTDQQVTPLARMPLGASH